MTTEENQIRNQAINKTAELLKAKNTKIEELQSALRTCLTILYDVDDPKLEPARTAAIEQASQVL